MKLTKIQLERLNNLSNNVNHKEKYAVVDLKGNVIDTFKSKNTASFWLGKLKRQCFDSKLKVVLIENVTINKV